MLISFISMSSDCSMSYLSLDQSTKPLSYRDERIENYKEKLADEVPANLSNHTKLEQKSLKKQRERRHNHYEWNHNLQPY